MESLSRDEVADVLETIAPDLERVEAILLEASTAGTPFLTESASYLTKAGGKRLRPDPTNPTSPGPTASQSRPAGRGKWTSSVSTGNSSTAA